MSLIKSNKWSDFVLPPSYVPKIVVSPLFYSVKDFDKKAFLATNEFEYVKVCDWSSQIIKLLSLSILSNPLDYN